MVKFAHISDVHLGGWKQEPLQDLNFQSFQMAVDACINQKTDFVLISGDLFDSAYPPIDILKKTFAEFRRLKDSKIPCFIIPGSHDYSVSGKTFLDVLEKAGFCKNVADFEIIDEKIILNPTIYEGVAIYGYPGRKSGLEVADLRKIKLNDSPGMFKIFMLHTTIDAAKGNLPIDAIESKSLPQADYYAMGHLHIDFQYQNFVYPGPIFPNNFQELEDLKYGSFYIVDTEETNSLKKIELKIKEIESFDIEIKTSLTATEKIISEIDKRDIKDKIVLLRVKGELETGKNSDIKFSQIEDFVKQKNAYFMLKNTHNLKTKEVELEIEVKNTEDIEKETIKIYSEKNPSDFNDLIPQLIHTLSMDKQEGETSESFTNRLLDEAKKVLRL
ncbi:MAG TPA: DNA repair exonuclease [Candidatus Pacearchaeota archaeon]|nr:putative metallophosphoesterase YhaO [archaeon BMS3Abin17]HDK42816.1 DNA repair exonuclease [Candidatus Pacearchaeota archaeon]HDZ61365.1 DNA repair exonuclease [Candidatus Pacearchaeota archaeon]